MEFPPLFNYTKQNILRLSYILIFFVKEDFMNNQAWSFILKFKNNEKVELDRIDTNIWKTTGPNSQYLALGNGYNTSRVSTFYFL